MGFPSIRHSYLFYFLTFLLTLAVKVSSTYAQGVVADISKKDVPIEWNFTGTNLLLFGAIEKKKGSSGPVDVVIVVKGPDHSVFTRQKKRIAGVWVNTKAKLYSDVPAFYSIVSTRPLNKIAKRGDLELMGIGLGALTVTLAQTNGVIKDGKPDDYSKALVRLMQVEELYRETGDGVKLINNKLFRANIQLPANVPVGNFHADVYLFQDGELVSLSSLPLVIQKKGLERIIYSLAYDYPFIYGVMAVLIAVFAGLIATALFNDD